MAAELIELVSRLGQPEVLVLGDLMLDRYIWGDAERISQEAPVILLHADKREERLGGASSVAMMLASLGAKVILAGVTGADADAGRIREILDGMLVDHHAVIPDASRPTTVKERYIGRAQARHPQQMLRVDYEVRDPLSKSVEDRLCAVLFARIAVADIVLISDYDKGVCTPRILKYVIEQAHLRGIRVIADPIRGSDYSKYRGCSAITPNRLEAGLATGRTIQTTDQAFAAARILRDTLGLEAAIVTLDKDGMALCHRDGREIVYPTRPRQVYDITGAGDMVMSVLGLAIAAGADYPDAIRLGNVAGGLEVEKIGVVTVSREEILQDLHDHPVGSDGNAPDQWSKVPEFADLLARVERHRREGRRIVFTNGCFDVLHAGHTQYLSEARAQGDILIVGLNSDESVRSLKGPTRPINPIDARAFVLASLASVDYIAVFGEATPIGLIEAIRPDVLVKGADYTVAQVVGAEFVAAYGGRVHLADLREGFSTTKVLSRLRAA